MRACAHCKNRQVLIVPYVRYHPKRLGSFGYRMYRMIGKLSDHVEGDAPARRDRLYLMQL